jgi:hypothetical protein
VIPPRSERRHAHVDVLGTRGRQQHVIHIGVVAHRPDHLVIEADFVDRVRDVLVRLDLDLAFQIVIGKLAGHRNDAGDHGGAGHRGRAVPELGTRTRQRATNRLAYRLDFHDVLFDHGIGRQWLDRVMLDAIATAHLT